MLVSELIEKLKKTDQNLEVCMKDGTYSFLLVQRIETMPVEKLPGFKEQTAVLS